MTRILTGFLILLTLILSVGYYYQLHIAKDNILYTDYGKFYQSTRFVLEGKPIYTPIFFKKSDKASVKHQPVQLPGNLNPPIFTLLVLPIGFFSYAASLTIWALFSIACGIFSILLLQKELNMAWKNPWVSCAMLLAFFSYYPTFSSVEFGQMTLLLMPLVVGAWVAARKKKYAVAGVLLGVAASIKLFFGLFFLYFLLRREWRGLCWFSTIFMLGILIPFLCFGEQVFLDYWHILKTIQWSASSWNVSIYGFLLRLTGGPELNTPLVPAPYATRILYVLISAALLLRVVQMLRPTSRFSYQEKLDIDFSVILIAMLLLSPLGWLYYFPYLVIPIVVLLQLGNQKYHSIKLTLLTIFAVMLSGLSTPLVASGFIEGKYVVIAFASSSCYFAALLILLGLLLFVRDAAQSLPVRPVSLRTTQPLNRAQPASETRGVLLSHTLLATLLAVALVPSLIGILKVSNALGIYGAGYSKAFEVSYYGY